MSDPRWGSVTLARDCAGVWRGVFDEYHEAFRAAAGRSARHFPLRDWLAVRDEATDRLRLYARNVDHAIAQIGKRARQDRADRGLWVAMRDEYAALVDGRPAPQDAQAFFSTV